MGQPLDEENDSLWFWDTSLTLAEILPQIHQTENGPAQMELCSANREYNGDFIDWVMIHSPINGIIVEGAPEEAAVGVMTSFKRSELIQIHC